jgi:soluble lytic murein transglycosylase
VDDHFDTHFITKKKEPETIVLRAQSNLYISNLKNYVPPTEKQLIQEATFSNIKLYNQSARILSDWILRHLTHKERIQIAKKCNDLTGDAKTEFPLNEQTLACAAWWLERKHTEEMNPTQKNLSSQSTHNFVTLRKKQKKVWENYQNRSFTNAFSQLDPNSFEEAKNLFDQALAKNALDCSYANAGAALILRFENFLPQQEVYSKIDTIYSHIQKCLQPNTEPSEKIHMRVGLLRLIYGNSEQAAEALKKALQDDEPSESSRSLFWLGTILQKNQRNTPAKENPYWQKLIKENSISLPALVASYHMGIDPLNHLASDEEISLQGREATGWSDNNLEAFILDMLLARDNQQAALQWSGFVARTTDLTNPKMLMYWSLRQNEIQNHKYAITFLGRYGKYEKNYKISRKMLELHFPNPYLKEIAQYSKKIDPLLILSVMRQESAFDPHARSAANARGLMQILPSTAKSIKKRLSSHELYRPETNIKVGISYLNKFLKKYDGKIEYVLAAYNAGASNLDKWRDRISNENMILFCDFMPFRETRNYVSLILRNYYWYNRLLLEKNDKNFHEILKQSTNSRWKSDSVTALLSSLTETEKDQNHKNVLNKIYIFGEKPSHMSLNTINRYTQK